MDPEMYFSAIYQIRDRPRYQRITAEKRFLLIKEYEDFFLPVEKERLGKGFRKVEAIKKYCALKGISSQAFYKWYRRYRENGIEGLLPEWGHCKGKSRYNDTFLPIMLEIIKEIEPGRGFTYAFDKVKASCEVKGISVPDYTILIRMLRREGLADLVAGSKKNPQENAELLSESLPEEGSEEIDALRLHEPGWIRFTNNRAFNIAMYKYNLILPFLDPNLDSLKEQQMIEDIVGRKHYVLPGVEIEISEDSLYKYIAAYNKDGFNGLVAKYYVREKPAIKGDSVKIRFEIDMKNPLASLERLKEIIALSPSTSPRAKEISLKFMENELEMIRPGVAKYKPRWLAAPLTDDEIQKLEAYKAGHHLKRSNRAKAVLMANDNHTMLEIMMETGASHQTIYKWLQRFKQEGLEFIEAKRHHPEREKRLAERKTSIIEILHGSPNIYGINRASWTYDTIARAYNQTHKDAPITRYTVARAIKSTGYSWRHARTVLTSPDPPLQRENGTRSERPQEPKGW